MSFSVTYSRLTILSLFFNSVKENHRLKAHEAESIENEPGARNPSPDLQMHLDMQKAINRLEEGLKQKSNRNKNRNIRSLSSAARDLAEKKKNKYTSKDFYFDYNTVEQILISCSIFLCLIAIMFESGQFYRLNPETGLEELNPDPTR